MPRSQESQKLLEALASDIAAHPTNIDNHATTGVRSIADEFSKYDAIEKMYDSDRGTKLASLIELEDGLAIKLIEIHPGGGVHALPYIRITKRKGKVAKVVYGKATDYQDSGEEGVDCYFLDKVCPFGGKGYQVTAMLNEYRETHPRYFV